MECLETQTLGHFLSLGLNGEVSICKSQYLESSLKTVLLKMMQKSGSLWEEVCTFIFPVKLPGMAESTTRVCSLCFHLFLLFFAGYVFG